jgi:hypothetical protein
MHKVHTFAVPHLHDVALRKRTISCWKKKVSWSGDMLIVVGLILQKNGKDEI